MPSTIVKCLKMLKDINFEKKDIELKNNEYKNAEIAKIQQEFDNKTYEFVCVKYLHDGTEMGNNIIKQY